MSTARAELYRRLPVTADVGWWQRIASDAPDGSVLYLGAGTGRLAVPVARHARRLVAVEPDRAMRTLLHQASHDAAPPRPAVEVAASLGEDVDPEERFGAVLLPSHLLNELLDANERRATLAAAVRHCRPDGRLAIQVVNPYWVAAGADGQGVLASATSEQVRVAVTGAAFDPWTRRHRAEVTYRFADGTVLHDMIDAVALFPGDLERLFVSAGCEVVERWGPRPGLDPLAVAGASWSLVLRPT